MGRTIWNLMIAVLSLGFAVVAYFYKEGVVQLVLTGVGIVLSIYFFLEVRKKEDIRTHEIEPLMGTQVTELALLNEEDAPISYWQMYGKSSLVIGLDLGENHVDVNLLHTTYASTIDVEHAVLNYSGGNWYVEDNDSKNGVHVRKSDGRNYKLNNAKPCLVEKGDVISISMAKLKLC